MIWWKIKIRTSIQEGKELHRFLLQIGYPNLELENDFLNHSQAISTCTAQYSRDRDLIICILDNMHSSQYHGKIHVGLFHALEVNVRKHQISN